MPFFSVIIPIYKAEAYLRECVDSVLDQSFRDFELILVDDGSPDGCPAICDEYAEKDVRVRVIHKENGGVSSARNMGMKAATGEYLAFLDSDDFWCGPDGLQIIYAALESRGFQVDTLIFGVERMNMASGEILPRPYYPPELNELDSDAVGRELLRRNTLLSSAIEKVLLRSFVEEHQLYFDETVITAEDGEWVMRTTACSPRYYFINDAIYRTRRGTPDVFHGTRWDQYEAMCDFLKQYLHQEYPSEAVKRNVLGLGAYHYTLLCGQVSAGEPCEARRALLAKLKGMRSYWNYDDCPKVKMASRTNGILGFQLTAWLLALRIRRK